MGRLLAVTLLAGMAGIGSGCGDDDENPVLDTTTTAPTTATTTTAPAPADARLTKEGYIRQGDALCADANKKWNEVISAQDRAPAEDEVRYAEQTEAVLRDLVTRFTALKGPLADQPTADQLNRLLQQNLAKEGERLGALRAGDEEGVERIVAENENLDRQFAGAARAYGFVECPRAFGA